MQVPAGNANAITGEAAVVPTLGSKLGKALKSAIPFAQIFAEKSSAAEMPEDLKAEEDKENAGKLAEIANLASPEKPAAPQAANPQAADKGSVQAAIWPGTEAPAEIFQAQMRQRASKTEADAEAKDEEALKSSSEHDESKHSSVHRQHAEEASRTTASLSRDGLDEKSISSAAPFSIPVPVPAQQRIEPVPSGARREPALRVLSSQSSAKHTMPQGPHEILSPEAHAGSVSAQDAASEISARSPAGKPAILQANGKEQLSSSPLPASSNQVSSNSSQADSATLHEAKASFAETAQPEMQPASPVSGNDIRAAAVMQQPAAAAGKQKSPAKLEAADTRSIKAPSLEAGIAPSAQTGTAAASGATPFVTGRHLSSGSGDTSGTDSNPFQHLDAGDAQATLMHSSAREVVVGVRDPSLGWVEIQTQSSGGHVNASLAAASPEAHTNLAVQMPAIAQYLEDRNVHVHTLDVGMQAGMQHGNGGQQSPASGNAEREAFQPPATTRGQAHVPPHTSSIEPDEHMPAAASTRFSVRA